MGFFVIVLFFFLMLTIENVLFGKRQLLKQKLNIACSVKLYNNNF
jgi:hypothetical protein